MVTQQSYTVYNIDKGLGLEAKELTPSYLVRLMPSFYDNLTRIPGPSGDRGFQGSYGLCTCLCLLNDGGCRFQGHWGLQWAFVLKFHELTAFARILRFGFTLSCLLDLGFAC